MLRTRRPLLVLIAIIALLVIGYVAKEVDSGSDSSSPGRVTESSLPVQARQTLEAIQNGGPFPYSEDGEVFRNAEHLLPAEASGYYHEYTVTTPGESTRGTRRIITGRNHEFYYTSDHYRTFHRVTLNR